MKRTLTPYLTGAAALASLGGAHAQPQQGLEEIVVTARSIEETLAVELAEYGHDVELVGADAINRAGYKDVSAALQFEVPGLFVSPGSGAFDYVDLSLQGSRTGDALWLIDGIRINNRIFNGTSPDTLPAGMVERIEVLKGGESLFYGTQGVAGAINMVTRSFSGEPDGQLVLNADSNGGHGLSGYGRAAIGDHKFVVYGSKNESDGYVQYDAFEPSATDRKRGYDVENIGVKYGYDLSDRARIDVLYHHTDAMLDNNSPVRTKRSYNNRDEDVASVKLAYDVADHVQLLVKGYLHDWDTTYANIQNSPVTGNEVVVYPPGTYWGFRDYGANALVKVSPDGPAEYHFGYDYQNYKARDDVFPIAGNTETVNAVFGEIRSSEGTFDKGSVAAGIRYNRGTSGKTATVWNVSGRYDFNDSLYLQGMLSTAFLLPSAEQLYYVGNPGDDDYVGNPDLEPEESENVNLTLGGAAGPSDAFRWSITVFARDIDNLIDIGCDDPAYPNCRYENVAGVVEVRGAEASVSVTNDAGFGITASHTYTESRTQGSSLQLARTPISFTKLGFVYQPAGARFAGNVNLNRVGDTFQSVGAFGRQNFGGYVVMNLAGRVVLDAAGRHKVGFGVDNVTDKEYATRLAQAQRDDGSGAFLVQRLGVPRTFNMSYTVGF
jgi:vitamin B12 transporter